MARPRENRPTPAELEVLNLLWDQGPLTVREVHTRLQSQRPRGYTSVLSLLGVMHDKRLVLRKPEGRAFRYAPARPRERTLRNLLEDVLRRAFQGSSSALVVQLLEQAAPDEAELSAIRAAIESYERQLAETKAGEKNAEDKSDA